MAILVVLKRSDDEILFQIKDTDNQNEFYLILYYFKIKVQCLAGNNDFQLFMYKVLRLISKN